MELFGGLVKNINSMNCWKIFKKYYFRPNEWREFKRQSHNFEKCCKREHAALIKKLHETDLKKFNEITEMTKVAQFNLSAARENLVKMKITQIQRPWTEEFNIALNQYFEGNVPESKLNQFARLYYLYELNDILVFYKVVERILKKSDGDLELLSILLHDAAIDFRDILA